MKKLLSLFLLSSIIHPAFSQVALNFNGPTDFVQTTYSGVLGSADRTIEAWVYVDSNAPNANLTITDYGRNTAGDRNTFMVNASRNLAYISGGGSTGNFSSSAQVPLEVWTHVALVISSRVGYLYINGVQVGTNSLSSVSTPSGQTNLLIGQRVSGGSIPFYGSIDEVRCWNTARTAAELLANMNAEFCSVPVGLEAYYRFNEGIPGGNNTAISRCIDDIGGENGTLTNFLLTTGDSSNYVTGPALSQGFSTSLVKDSLCSPFTSPSGNVYTTTGIYFDTLINAVSCDSLVRFDLTITDLSDSVHRVGGRMTSIDTWANHQWVRCDSGFSPISGATSRIYDATQTGDYAVIVSKGNCTDTSDCIIISLISITKQLIHSVKIFPNPVNSVLTIENSYNLNLTQISILDISGKVVREVSINRNQKVDVTDLRAGVYFLRLQSQDDIAHIKFLKE